MSRRPGSPRALSLPRSIRVLTASTDGGTAIEYALIAGLVTIVIVGALGEVADALVGLPLSALIDAFASALS